MTRDDGSKSVGYWRDAKRFALPENQVVQVAIAQEGNIGLFRVEGSTLVPTGPFDDKFNHVMPVSKIVAWRYGHEWLYS